MTLTQWIITIAANVPALLAAITAFIMSLRAKATANAAHDTAAAAHATSALNTAVIARHVIMPLIRAKMTSLYGQTKDDITIRAD